MSNALRRAARTFIQTFIGTVITSGILSSASQTGVVDWSAAKKVAVAALAAAIVAVLSWAQNALEDKNVVPKVLKNESGAITLAELCLLVLVAIALLWAFGALPR